MKCPRCQANNREGGRFCVECGASLTLGCPSCGFSNEPGENFCGGCGQALQVPAAAVPAPKLASPESYTPKHIAETTLTSKRALEGERKQVRVLFADLKGPMELLADGDPEEARKLLDPVLERMTDGSLALADRVYRQRQTHRGEVVDPIGAGEAFAAGFLYGYLTDGIQRGLDLGAAMGALACTVAGDFTLVTGAEAEELLASGDQETQR